MTGDRVNHTPAVKRALADPKQLLDALGLLRDRGGFERQANGFLIRCVVHGDKTPSCSVQQRQGIVLWNCHACGATGDALSLVAAVRGLKLPGEFRATLREAAAIAGLWDVVDDIDGRVSERAARREVAPPPPPAPAPEPPREYPPAAEVAALWAAARPVAGDPEAAAWCRSRGLDPEAVDAGGLARALPKDGSALPRFAAYKGRSWVETGHRLIVPMRSVLGAFLSQRACQVGEGGGPKRLPPAGHKASGLVMANDLAIAMLCGTYAPANVVIVEGEPDYLTAATEPTRLATAVIGIVSGSWSRAFAERIPINAQVRVWTDRDQAGDRYAREIVSTLRNRCHVTRWRGRRAEGKAA